MSTKNTENKTETKSTKAPAKKRPAAIEIGKTASGKRVSSTQTRFLAVFAAVSRNDQDGAKKALKRALPEYLSQDYLDAASLYRGQPNSNWMVNLCMEVGTELAAPVK